MKFLQGNFQTLLKNKLKSHHKYDKFDFGRRQINRIFFVFMNNGLLNGDIWHILVVNFPAQVLLTKIKAFSSKMKEQLEKGEDQIQVLILSLSIRQLIKFYPLLSCCLLSALRLWA